jgi:Right handed beta helix region
MRRYEVVILTWLTLAAGARAADIFVDNVQGDDRHDGTAAVAANRLSGPLRSITQALRISRAGDRIVVAKTDQPYRESVTLSGPRHSGNVLQPFVIEGNGATLEGAERIPHDAWQHDRGAVFRYRPPRTSFQQLFLDDKPAVRRYLDSLHGRLPDLKPREWCLFNGSIYFCVEQDKLPGDYRLSCAALSVGITLYEVHDVVISDLVVQGYQLDGVNAHDGVTECLLAGLTCRGNGRAGVAVMGASRVEISGCLIGDNGAAQLYTEGQSLASLENSDLLPGTAPPVVRRGGRVFADGKRLDVPK